MPKAGSILTEAAPGAGWIIGWRITTRLLAFSVVSGAVIHAMLTKLPWRLIGCPDGAECDAWAVANAMTRAIIHKVSQ